MDVIQLLRRTLLIGIEISMNTANQFVPMGNEIFGVIQVIGIISSVIALSLVGIKYMLSSVEEKAEYKRTFSVYIIGAILVFGISLLLEPIYELINGLLS